jgi:hypothetical protein
MDDAAMKAEEDAFVDAYWANHPFTRMSAAMRALVGEALRPFERLVRWLSR